MTGAATRSDRSAGVGGGVTGSMPNAGPGLVWWAGPIADRSAGPFDAEASPRADDRAGGAAARHDDRALAVRRVAHRDPRRSAAARCAVAGDARPGGALRDLARRGGRGVRAAARGRVPVE